MFELCFDDSHISAETKPELITNWTECLLMGLGSHYKVLQDKRVVLDKTMEPADLITLQKLCDGDSCPIVYSKSI